MPNLSNGHKWCLALCTGLIFLMIASPLTYELTGKFTSYFNWTTSTKGCPNWKGLLLHTIVFILLVRLLMMIPWDLEKEGWAPPLIDQGFLGLANGAQMNQCNAAQLAALNHGCQPCAQAATVCMSDPFNIEKCNNALMLCNKSSCSNGNVVAAVQAGCRISGTHDYSPRGTPSASRACGPGCTCDGSCQCKH
jgi:hypothetical protein